VSCFRQNATLPKRKGGTADRASGILRLVEECWASCMPTGMTGVRL
jgi:hypothetical protein